MEILKKIITLALISIVSSCGSGGGGGSDSNSAAGGTLSSDALQGVWYSPTTACSFTKKTASLAISKSTINKNLYTATLQYYDDTLYSQFLFDIEIKEINTSNSITSFNYSADGNMPSGGAGDISTSSLLKLSNNSLELSNGCAINESLIFIQDSSQVLNSSTANHEQETTIIRNAHLQSFNSLWATAYADLVGKGVAGSQACGARASLFESYLQSMTNEIFTTLLKYSPLNLPSEWYYMIYDDLKALDVNEAQYSQGGSPCTLLPNVELFYQFLYR